MGRQLPLFTARAPDADDALNARLAARDQERREREATKPRHRDDRAVLRCPNCRGTVIVSVVAGRPA